MTTNRNEADALSFNLNLTHRISRNFTAQEWASKCGTSSNVLIHPILIAGVQEIRDRCGFPIRINSGYRTEAHNRAVNGSPNSLHTKGMAVDLSPVSNSARELSQIIQQAQALGFVTRAYSAFVHIDVGQPRTW